jgi:hypothetical protein
MPSIHIRIDARYTIAQTRQLDAHLPSLRLLSAQPAFRLMRFGLAEISDIEVVVVLGSPSLTI